jgi:hypothetical protein
MGGKGRNGGKWKERRVKEEGGGRMEEETKRGTKKGKGGNEK